jgi:glutathione S-transferase
VWLQLEEKRIPYTIEKINMRCYGDKPPSFMAKVCDMSHV